MSRGSLIPAAQLKLWHIQRELKRNARVMKKMKMSKLEKELQEAHLMGKKAEEQKLVRLIAGKNMGIKKDNMGE